MAFKKRNDGIYLKDLPATRRIFPYLMPTRTESLVYLTHRIKMENLGLYLKKKNKGKEVAKKIGIFHCILTAASRTLKLRPQMNRFIVGHRIYEHNDIKISFVIKKEMKEEAPDANVQLMFTGEETLEQVRDMVNAHLDVSRSDIKSEDDKLVDLFASLPRPLINLTRKIIFFLDYHNILPEFLRSAIPFYASLFLANLGSIGLEAPYHHLFEMGNVSLFMATGRLHKDVFVNHRGEISAHDCMNVSFTLDECIADGFYYAKSILMFADLLENPEKLEQIDLPV